MMGALSLGTVAACGSSAKPTATTVASGTATTVAGGTATTAAASTGGASAAVTTFCNQASDLATKIKAAVANPSGGTLAAVQADATKLSTSAASLIAANPGDQAKIEACVKAMTDALTPG